MSQKLSTNQIVNKVGKYLYKNIDSAFKAVRSSNTYDVYMTMYYQLPREQQVPGREDEVYNDVHEMIINISLTTYQNKIRVNIHEHTPNQWTFGYILIPPEKLEDLEYAKDLIYNKVKQKLEKHYEGYNFLY